MEGSRGLVDDLVYLVLYACYGDPSTTAIEGILIEFQECLSRFAAHTGALVTIRGQEPPHLTPGYPYDSLLMIVRAGTAQSCNIITRT